MRRYYIYCLDIPDRNVGYIQLVGSHARNYTLMFYKVEFNKKSMIYVSSMS